MSTGARRAALLLGGALAAALPAPLAALSGPWATNPQTKVRLLSSDRVAAERGELRLGIEFRVIPEWHVYWKNSGDAGFPPIIKLLPAPGLSGGALLYPAPHRFDLRGGLVAFGYEHEVVYPVLAHLDGAPPGTLHLAADVDYLTCQIDCVPYRVTLHLDLPVGPERQVDPETAPLLERWWEQIPRPLESEAGVTAKTTLDLRRPSDPVLKVAVDGVATAGSPDLFFETQTAFVLAQPVLQTTATGVVFTVPFHPAVLGQPLPAHPRFAWTMTGLRRGGRLLSLEAASTAVPADDVAAPAGVGMAAVPPVAAHLPPVPAALLVAAAVLAALTAWGFLAAPRELGKMRILLGFLLLAMALLPLYALSLEIRSEALAGVEIAVLAMALLAWLRGRTQRSQGVRFLLACLVLVCALLPAWLASGEQSTPAALATAPAAAPPGGRP